MGNCIITRAIKVSEPTLGLIALYHFDNNLHDSLGHANLAGNLDVSSDYAKFGGKSLKSYGLNYTVRTNSYNGFALGDSDFTIDFWVYNTSLSNQVIVDLGAQKALQISIENNGKYCFSVASSDSAWDVSETTNTSPTLNTWEHIAFIRHGNSFDFYVDGVKVHSATSNVTINSSSKELVLCGTRNNDYFSNNYIDELAIRNYAVWTHDFTPPNQPYTI